MQRHRATEGMSNRARGETERYREENPDRSRVQEGRRKEQERWRREQV